MIFKESPVFSALLTRPWWNCPLFFIPLNIKKSYTIALIQYVFYHTVLRVLWHLSPWQVSPQTSVPQNNCLPGQVSPRKFFPLPNQWSNKCWSPPKKKKKILKMVYTLLKRGTHPLWIILTPYLSIKYLFSVFTSCLQYWKCFVMTILVSTTLSCLTQLFSHSSTTRDTGGLSYNENNNHLFLSELGLSCAKLRFLAN